MPTLPRIQPRAYERVVLFALVAITVIIVTGGAVRVTGSGLGCPDWPTCQDGRIVAETEFHALIEFGNRVFTGVVSLGVVLAVLGSLIRAPRRKDLTLWSLVLVVGVALQAILGGLLVKAGLDPRFTIGHFLLSQFLVWAALVLYRRARQPAGRPVPMVHRDYIWLARLVIGLAAAVIVLGTLVTGSGPHGGDPDAPRFAFDISHITRVHSTCVWAMLGITVFTVWRLNAAKADKRLIRKGEIAIAAMLLQGAIGYLQYSLAVPAGLVLVHIAGATAVWMAVVWFYLSFWERWEESGLHAYDAQDEMPPVVPTD